MRARKLVAILLCLAVILSIFSHVSSQIVSPPKGMLEPALLPWTVKVFRTSNNIPFVSAGFAGVNQIPAVSFLDGQTYNLAYKVDSTTNECGPGLTWTCQGIDVFQLGVNPQVSPLANHSDPYGFRLAWVWKDASGNKLRLRVDSYQNDFSSSGSSGYIDLIPFNTGAFSGYDLVGNPSLAWDSTGLHHVAVVLIKESVDYLVYIHQDPVANTTCGINSNYRCAIIEAGFYGDMVQISMTSSDSPRIAYYHSNDDSLKYAYPQTNLNYHPNCGPLDGDNFTWRCIVMDQGPGAEIINQRISMDIGQTGSPQIAYFLDSGLTRNLMHAKYVSSGGDCGEDYRFTGTTYALAFRWKCTTVTAIDSSSPFIDGLVSLKVDPNNYAVIAYAQDHNGPVSLNLAYPAERLGGPIGSYSFDEIDLPLEKTNSLAINNAGLGFIAYKTNDVLGDLRIAYQQFSLNLPIIRR